MTIAFEGGYFRHLVASCVHHLEYGFKVHIKKVGRKHAYFHDDFSLLQFITLLINSKGKNISGRLNKLQNFIVRPPEVHIPVSVEGSF